MQIIPSSLLPQRDKDSLRQFLEGCREAAQKKGHYQIASISLAVRHIAPLAVLQSIYEPDELHFYVERGADDEALAGAEAVVQATFDGPERFSAVKAFADDVLENTIAVGDLEEPFTGPHFFTAFTFDESVESDSPFPSATVFLPRWQVSRGGGKYGAVANVKVDPDGDLDPLVERLWAAYQKFAGFDYADDPALVPAREDSGGITPEELAPGVYRDAVSEALARIDEGAFEKIVLARGLRLQAPRAWRPLPVLHRLRERFPGCYTFSFGGGSGRSFIGATPERLLRIWDGRLETEAIAGSAPRGGDPQEDARFAKRLLESEKDLREHQCVCDSILRRLDKLQIEGRVEGSPRLLALPNVQHLRTRIEAELGPEISIVDILPEMHPTPAVGGTPREPAVSRIRELEQIDRGLYAGVVGWFNHLNDGEMIVAIRSALIDGNEACLYAGAGIVEGSDPEKEFQETELKLKALLDVLAPDLSV